MKKILILMAIVFITLSTNAIPYYEWSNPLAFINSPSPAIQGYGPLSHSLSVEYGGKTFYEYNGEYYIIETWADYYRWYVTKYWFMFSEPGLYEYYYDTGDDYGMASYIYGDYYRGTYYPSSIEVMFPANYVFINRSRDPQRRICNRHHQDVLLVELNIYTYDRVYIKQLRKKHKNYHVAFENDRVYNRNIQQKDKLRTHTGNSYRHVSTYNNRHVSHSRHTSTGGLNNNRTHDNSGYSNTTTNRRSNSGNRVNNTTRRNATNNVNSNRNSSRRNSVSNNTSRNSSNTVNQNSNSNRSNTGSSVSNSNRRSSSSNVRHKLPPQRSTETKRNNSKRKTSK